jgi:hypothetical protein
MSWRTAVPATARGRQDGRVSVEVARFLRLVEALPEAGSAVCANWTAFSVRDRKFGYLWPRTRTAGLKQTMSEQLALVAERPEVFEAQFTAGGFGWVVVHLDGIELDELSELVLEAWRLTAPEDLLEGHPGPEDLVRGRGARIAGPVERDT